MSNTHPDIITRCPQCNTAFRVTQDQLSVADGMVRCGSCLTVFKANAEDISTTNDNVLIADQEYTHGLTLEEGVYNFDMPENEGKSTSLFERRIKPVTPKTRESADESWALAMLADMEDDRAVEPQSTTEPAAAQLLGPSTTTGEVPPHQIQREEDTQPTAGETSSNEQQDASALFQLVDDASAVHEPTGKPSSPSPISEQAIADAIHKDLHQESSDYLFNIEPSPVEMEPYQGISPSRRGRWLVGIVLASLTLLIQIAIFRFETFSKHPNYRPYYSVICEHLGCHLPPLLAPHKIRTTNLVIREHPSRQHALIIDAILINSAAFEQPYPALRLEFEDNRQTTIAARDLQPGDYLSGELTNTPLMPVNQPIQISVALVDPGENASSYRLLVTKAGI